MPVAQSVGPELYGFAPAFPFSVDVKPEAVRLGMPALRVASLAQFYRIRRPVIIFHAVQHITAMLTSSVCPE